MTSTHDAVITCAHTADLEPGALPLIRRLLDDAFASEFSDDDWDHALGGIHAMAWEGGELAGHASVVQRRLIHRHPVAGEHALRCGYVEAVAVRADRRRSGIGSALMAPLERIIGRAYALGALGASADGARLYAERGWKLWRGRAWTLTPAAGRVRTADEEGAIWVWQPERGERVPLDLDGDLTCDWREGDVW